MTYSLRDHLDHIAADGVADRTLVEARLRDGTLTFLLDANGNFRPTEFLAGAPK